MNKDEIVFIAAGGTGGHINAAIALGEQILKKKIQVHYLTGKRNLDYKLFENYPVIHLDGQPLREKNIIKLSSSLIKNILTFLKIMKLFLKNKPKFIIGCGGYICGPALLAGKILGIPLFIFEQNAVMGMTNKILSFISDKIFLHFKNTIGVKNYQLKKCSLIGNPTRNSIKFTEPKGQNTRKFLIFGGSLGASQINQMIYDFIQIDQKEEYHFIHQTGTKEKFDVKLGKNIHYHQQAYLDNIQEQYEWCDYIIARAGASTVAELKIVQKPCFLIPFPQATDNHQYFNSKSLAEEVLFPVHYVDPKDSNQKIYQELSKFIMNPPKKDYKLKEQEKRSVAEMAVEEILKYVGI
jgi:UDP-N-acetylglucosamine--N-acetylmuramyl-(pentapeptide) pyrophosphoryl-undecaprenol N-acetylglucosamine transferase